MRRHSTGERDATPAPHCRPGARRGRNTAARSTPGGARETAAPIAGPGRATRRGVRGAPGAPIPARRSTGGCPRGPRATPSSRSPRARTWARSRAPPRWPAVSPSRSSRRPTWRSCRTPPRWRDTRHGPRASAPRPPGPRDGRGPTFDCRASIAPHPASTRGASRPAGAIPPTRCFDPDAALLTSDAGVPHTATELTARTVVRSAAIRQTARRTAGQSWRRAWRRVSGEVSRCTTGR